MRVAAVVVSLALVGLAAVARADIFAWTDAEGVVHFTNIPPKGAGRGKWKKVMDQQPEKG